jgi:uncharacterized protein (UPF0333 family)
MKLKKWHEWTIVVLVGLLVVVAAGATYYFLTVDKSANQNSSITAKSDADVTAIDAALKDANDLNLTDLDSIDAELNSIDLSGV